MNLVSFSIRTKGAHNFTKRLGTVFTRFGISETPIRHVIENISFVLFVFRCRRGVVMNKKVIVLGKGSLAIRIAEWFCESNEYKLVQIVPVIPEPAWTDSFIEWAN